MTGILTRVAPFTDGEEQRSPHTRQMVAKHTEELGNGILVQATVIITAEPRGWGAYQEWRARKHGHLKLEPYGDPTILFTYFVAEANVSIFHYGQKVSVENLALNVSDMGWEGDFVDALIPISIGAQHVRLSLEGKGEIFKGFPVTPEIGKLLDARLKKSSHLSLRLHGVAPNTALYLERQLRKQSKSRKPCSFPQSLRVEFTEEEPKT